MNMKHGESVATKAALIHAPRREPLPNRKRRYTPPMPRQYRIAVYK